MKKNFHLQNQKINKKKIRKRFKRNVFISWHNKEKLFSYNDVLLLTHKNSYSNSIGGDTTITNNNNNLSENKKENTILYG